MHHHTREVWQLLAESETTKGIALILNVSAKTIEYHRCVLCQLLGTHSIALITRAAVAAKLITL